MNSSAKLSRAFSRISSGCVVLALAACATATQTAMEGTPSDTATMAEAARFRVRPALTAW
jgi:molybdopterin biosynthesis enzyme MoaB